LASEDPKICKQGTASKMKHVTSGIPQNLEIIRNIEKVFGTSNESVKDLRTFSRTHIERA